jgi:hypothetical protein
LAQSSIVITGGDVPSIWKCAAMAAADWVDGAVASGERVVSTVRRRSL